MLTTLRNLRHHRLPGGRRRRMFRPVWMVVWWALAAGPLRLPAAEDAASPTAVPPDECILELDVPERATVTVDGQDFGTKRRLAYSSLKTDRAYQVAVHVDFPGGGSESHTVLVEGGRKIRLTLAGANRQRPELMLQGGHRQWIQHWAFSPDGRLLLTGGQDKQVILWDAATGKKLRVFEGHQNNIGAVHFSPDGRLALTAAFLKEPVHVWEVATGKLVRAFPVPTGLARFGSSARELVILEHQTAKTYDVESGQVLRSYQIPQNTDYTVPSGDGRWWLSVDTDRENVLWDSWSGQRAQTFPALQRHVRGIALSPDRRTLAVATTEREDEKNTSSYRNVGKVTLWEIASAQPTRTFDPQAKDVHCVGFSPDGRQLAVGTDAALVFDVASGRLLQTFPHGFSCEFVRFDPHGQPQLLAAGHEEMFWWDVATGAKLRTWNPAADASTHISTLQLSPDGRRLLSTGGSISAVVLWDTDTGQQFGLPVGSDKDLAFTPDSRQLIAHEHDGIYFLDATTGQLVRKMNAPMPGFRYMALSPAGHALLAAKGTNTMSLWDLGSGQQLRTFEGHSKDPAHAVFSPDGRQLLTTAGHEETILWDATSGAQRHTFKNLSFPAHFSPDGRVLQFAGAISLWDTATGRKLRELDGAYHHAQFLPDGKRILTTRFDQRLNLWDVATGQRLREFDKLHTDDIDVLALRSDGRWALSAGEDHLVAVWDVATGAALRVFRGHSDEVETAAFSPDGRLVVSGSRDGTIRLWDVSTGLEQARLVSVPGPQSWDRLAGNHWLVATPDGLFDGSALGRQSVLFRVGGELNVVPVDRFFQDFYYPGLLAKIWRGEPPTPKVQLGRSAPPKIRIVTPGADGVADAFQQTIEVEVTDGGGGIRGPWLTQNAARVLSKSQTEQTGQTLRRRFPVTLIEGENQFEIHAATADGSWESEPARLTLRYERPLPKPDLYLLAVGVNRYRDPAVNLKFAAADAQAVADVFRQRGPALYRTIHAQTLLDEQATQAAVLAAIQDIAGRAQPQDALIVYLAGHGTMLGQQYYFLPHEFKRESENLEDDVRAFGLPTAKVGEAVAAVPALKRMLAFDTGQSGGPLGLTRTARNPFAFRGSIERLSRAQGAFTIAAVATTEQAQELPALSHGVLTYTLLAGLGAAESGPLREQWIRASGGELVVHALQWYGFAATHVPRLTREYYGQAQDVQHSTIGTSFPVLPIKPPAGKLPAKSLAKAPTAAAVATAPAKPAAPAVVPGAAGESKKPAAPAAAVDRHRKLHVVAVGINRYADEALSLKYARIDAQAIAEVFRRRGPERFGEVRVTELLDQQATRTAILDALKTVAGQATERDLLLIFVAGHGVMVGQRYYFIPHEFRRQSEQMLDDVRAQGLPADTIGEALAKVPALQRLLILDTCASGGALGFKSQGRDPFAFAGAIQRLGQGVFTIAAAAAGEEAQEIKELGHGVLTYALLAGLHAVDQGPLRHQGLQTDDPQGVVDALKWFAYAVEQVPELTKQYLGREQDVQQSVQGATFPLLSIRGTRVTQPNTSTPEAPMDLAADLGILELDLPSGVQVSLDGQNFGEQRRFEFRELEAGTTRAVQLQLKFPDGTIDDRVTHVEGGRSERLAVAAPRADRPELQLPLTSVGHLHTAQFTPDGRYVVTVGMVGGAIWEAATGQMLRPFRMTGVQRATLSQDGRQLICLVGSPSGTTSSVAFWDIVAGRKTRTIPLKGGGLQTWAITRDARQFVTAGYTDQKANVWDTASGQQLRTLWGHNGRIKVLEYSPDGRLLLSGSDDRTAVLWDRATGNRLRVLIGHESGIDAAAFSPDSQRVLTVAGYSKQAILWDTATGEKIRSFAIEEHVHRVAFSPDGRYVANDGDRGTPGSGVLVLRDPETGQAIRSFPGHQHPFGYLAFSPDGKSLLTAINQAATSYAVAYDVTQDHAPREYRGRICVSTLLSFSPDDRRMLSATADGRVTVWDLPAGRRVHNVTIEGTDYVQAAQFSPDGRMIAAGAGNSQARRGWTMVWETATGRPLHRLEGHEGLVMGLAFSSDGRRLVSCALPGDPIVWDLTTGKEVRRLSDEGNQLKRLAFSPDGQEIHGYSFDNRLGRGRIVAWNAETGKQVRSVSAGEGSISTATFSPDVRLLAAMVSPRGEWKPKLVVWECETGRQLHAWENIMSIAFVPFSADSRQLTVLGGDLQSPESVVYDLESGQKLRTYPELLVCGRRQDGRVLLTVGWDGVIRLVDTHSRRELVQLYVLDDGKEWLAVGPDGRFDGSEGGRKLITFRVDDTLGVVPVERFHDKFYHPNLLAEIWKALQ